MRALRGRTSRRTAGPRSTDDRLRHLRSTHSTTDPRSTRPGRRAETVRELLEGPIGGVAGTAAHRRTS
ncbi:hypothetical protein EA472_13825 [Natrarchaeobius oligotrophus]|uniref:Uncharacterized protein n=1 Tax=Natrarchaeobius chitinivorans TaxID=1679083 RepID=A0A3N6MB08_NATCH|nr:hypothetical protein EA472_13825 [Natrarchaeobius chitinivorans]